MKKILFDARMFGLENAGIGRYVSSLLSSFSQLPKVFEFHLLVRKDREKKISQGLGNFYIYHPVNSAHYTLSEQWRLIEVIKRINPDLVHFPHFNLPFFYSGAYVVTIHDLIKHFFKGRKTTTRKPWLYWPKYLGYRLLTRRAINQASGIIVPTLWWKKKLLEMYPKLTNRDIFVTWEGVGKIFRKNQNVSNKEKEKILNRYHLKPQKFFIYTGNVYPHKNVERLIKAFLILNNPSLKLAIVCSRSVFRDRLKKLVSSLNAQKQVVFLGFVPDEKLKVLYSTALALIQPSLMEGFGLTGLEAMASGCPVISSNYSCLPEVYGSAAIYFNPLRPDQLAKKMNELVHNQNKREELIRRGRQRAKRFSWKKTARETIKIYQKILSNER